jgi:hypothetical protein
MTPTGRGYDGFPIDGGLVGLFDEIQEREERMRFEEAIEVASRDEGFKASVYAMNTLLIQKGVYTQERVPVVFCGVDRKGTEAEAGVGRVCLTLRIVVRERCSQAVFPQ